MAPTTRHGSHEKRARMRISADSCSCDAEEKPHQYSPSLAPKFSPLEKFMVCARTTGPLCFPYDFSRRHISHLQILTFPLTRFGVSKGEPTRALVRARPLTDPSLVTAKHQTPETERSQQDRSKHSEEISASTSVAVPCIAIEGLRSVVKGGEENYCVGVRGDGVCWGWYRV